MKFSSILLGIVFWSGNIFAQTPIHLNPENPHYFIFRGKPEILITSAEHYGMVLNKALDYIDYLDMLKRYGFNQTRIFSGEYCEGLNSLGRAKSWENLQNTLAPRPGNFLTPWLRSVTPGYHNGGNKFDLDQWDESYFTRLKDFCHEAATRNIIVEIVLFTANYHPETWLYSPLNSQNNINGIGDIPFNEFHLLKHKPLIEAQLKMVRKIVREVNEFDNIYFEICNEPYWLKGVPGQDSPIREQQFAPEIDEWQNLITKTIVDTEQSLPKKHMIAQNIANTYHKIEKLNPDVSILNFHYAYLPDAVTDNYEFNKPVAFDETADGCNAPDRRREAWAFILAGGAEYSNLDWSFANDDLTGLGRNPSGRRESGKEVRDQLEILSSTMQNFDYIHSRPVDSLFRKDLPDGIHLYGLMNEGKDYIFYWLKTKKAELKKWSCPLPKNKYVIKFIDPVDGHVLQQKTIDHAGGRQLLNIPDFPDDMVLMISGENH